ncbi:hypothetical protein ACFTSF_05285 [Kribbella sp. NPDC056951]|uniref:hypothetical protein n=1 Tax=Kribbella sp. NPDC056951 TaxID=3345978 RepID=UPI00363DEC5D
MRKLAATTAAAVLLTTGLSTSAWAADPAPTDVQISWAGDKIRVTWKDDGVANTIRAVYPVTGGSKTIGGRIEGETNELEVLPTVLEADRDKVQITVAGRTTGQWGTPTSSVSFDTRQPTFLQVKDADLLADRSVRIRWTQKVRQDLTPNDPLDRPESEDWRTVEIHDEDGSGVFATYPFAPGSTTVTVPAQPKLSWLAVKTGNVWGTSSPASLENYVTVHPRALKAKMSVPALGVFSKRLGIYSSLSPSLSGTWPVELQARASSTAAWKTVGRYSISDIGNHETGIASLGGRQYRLWVPALKKINESWIDLFPAASTSAKASQTTTKFTDVGFDRRGTELGQTVNLIVKIQPALTVRGNLQRWVDGSWRNGPVVQITNGTARLPMKATVKGQPRYRVALPRLAYNGLPLVATTSSTFTLIV